MTAAAIIARVRASGGEIALTENRVRLKVPIALHDEIVSQIKTHRDAVILTLKRETSDPWDADDWRAYFDERAGIAEHDGGQSRVDAEATAFECCIVEWLNRNPAPSYPDRCAWCGRPDAEGHAVVPFGSNCSGHAWLHPACWSPWFERRRGDAVSALQQLGLSAPVSAGQTDRRSAS